MRTHQGCTCGWTAGIGQGGRVICVLTRPTFGIQQAMCSDNMEHFRYALADTCGIVSARLRGTESRSTYLLARNQNVMNWMYKTSMWQQGLARVRTYCVWAVNEHMEYLVTTSTRCWNMALHFVPVLGLRYSAPNNAHQHHFQHGQKKKFSLWQDPSHPPYVWSGIPVPPSPYSYIQILSNSFSTFDFRSTPTSPFSFSLLFDYITSGKSNIPLFCLLVLNFAYSKK